MDQVAVTKNNNSNIAPHILVVDDDLQSVELVSSWLKRVNYQITPAFSGQAALEALGCTTETVPQPESRAASRSRFDLVLLDMRMPDMRGVEVCRHIRAHADTARIPVLILSTLAPAQERIKALQAGANDYLTKPFHGAELLARVENLVRWHRAELETPAVSAIRSLEQPPAQSEKMAAASRLAAALAHEINNPLQAIHNCLVLTQHFPLETPEHADFLRLAGEEVERLINIVQHTLEFCRPSRGHRVPIGINDLLEQVVALTHKKLQYSDVELHLDLAPDLPLVPAIADQISQVILNLITNAVEAMPDGGQLKLVSRQVEQWVEISVIDDGPGLSQEHIDHLFQPFFTTKPAGTGLGLAISFGIVERHGGTIHVASAPRNGATFVVRLPVAPDEQ